MAEWTDTHAHLDAPAFDGDRTEVLGRARAAGVSRTIVVATDLESAARIQRLIAAERGLCGTVGVHAHDCAGFDDAARGRMEEMLSRGRVCAVGETGLDFFRDYAPREAQAAAFRAQAKLAARAGLPLVVHCRSAEVEVYRVLSDAAEESGRGVRGAMHCFSSDAAWAGRFCSLGVHISFAGTLTYPKSDALREAAQAVPEDRLLVETDCPYLPPQPRRGKRNEPAWVAETGAMLAKVRGWSPDETAARTTANAKALFGLD